MEMAVRPKKLPSERRDASPLRIRLSHHEHELLDKVANLKYEIIPTPGSGATATWAREILLAEAQRLMSGE